MDTIAKRLSAIGRGLRALFAPPVPGESDSEQRRLHLAGLARFESEAPSPSSGRKVMILRS